MRHTLPCLLALLSATPALAQREYGFDNRKGSGQEYLTPDETVKRMKVAPEFEVKLFAGEPDIVNPVAFSIDEKGRVWCVECFEYPSRTPKGKQPRDRIVILEDTDGDGKCDKRTVFCEGKDFPVSEERKKAGLGAFDLATGLEVGNGGVYVGAPPYLWFIENKDDKPGKIERVLSGFGSEDTHETLNTFQWGPDGWLYGLHGVFTQSNVKPLDGPETRMNAAVWRFHPKTKKFEIFAEGTSNPWGLDWRNTDGQFILACCVIPHLYHIVPGGIYKRQAGGSYNPYAYGYINEICDHTFHKESGWAHAGLISLDAPHIPEKYRNSVIFGSIHGCSVKQNILKPNGSSFTATKGEDFLVSGDKNFRPINMKWGPNGDIYLIDWHDQMPCHQAKPDEWDYQRGRVYRIQVKGTKLKKAEDLTKLTRWQLIKSIQKNETPYAYRTALRLLAEEKNAGAPDANDDVEANNSLPPRAVWIWKAIENFPSNTQFHHETLDNVQRRAWAVRMMGEWSEADGKIVERLVKRTPEEPTAEVRRELASAAIRLADKHDVTALIHALMQRKEDAKDPLIPHLTWLAYEKVISKKDGANSGARVEKELAFLAAEAPDNIFVRDHIVPKVMRRLVATGQPGDLKLCVKFVADVKDAYTREKALGGLVLALTDQTVDEPEGWKTLRAELKKEPRFESLVNKLAVNFRDPEVVKKAIATLRPEKPNAATAAEQAEAVRTLVLLKAPEAGGLIQTILLQHQNYPLDVVKEAARQLAGVNDPKLGPAILRNWINVHLQAMPEVVNSLSSRKEWAKALLVEMKGGTVHRSFVTDNAVIKMQGFNDKEINDLIEKAWGKVRKTPDELNKLIDKTRASLTTAPASFASGKKVFEAQCAKCHKFDGKGNEVGPPLDGAGRDIEYLLANVLDPNRVVGAPYFVRTANLLDGQAVQGILQEEDDLTLTLKVENAVLKKIAKKDLDGPVKVSEKSMMPEGLSAGMSEQDFRDLVRYVMTSPFLTDVTVGGKAVSVGVPGRIPLPEAKDTGEVVIVAEVTAADEVRTTLLLGGVGQFHVKLDERAIGNTESAKDAPDQIRVPVALAKGKHTLTLTAKYKGASAAVFARFLDPDRKLSYPEK